MKKPIMNTPFRLNRNQRRIVAAFMLACFLPTAVLALPTAPQVASGTAAVNSAGSAMTITSSANAVINWQGFSIGQGESVRFIQPSAASAVLNRITGGDPSRIFGALQSNGTVLLINPNGILFGPAARVDVGGLIASTLNISNQDFLAGRMKFSAAAAAAAGTVENQGAIATPDGGGVYLIAPEVTNSGIITAPNGDVLLAAGKEVLLVDKQSPEIAVVVSAPAHQVINLGTLVADAGRVGMYGSIVRQKGRISADSAVMEGGRIFLRATREATVEAGSTTSTDGIGSADGGTVIIKSDGTTVIDGDISAKGGAHGGSGGFAETSGGYLVVNKAPDLTAPADKAGTWLLDPYDIVIGSTDTPATYTGVPNYVGSGGVSPSFIGASMIAGVLDGGTSVVVDTTGSGGGTGNITVTSPINTANAGAATLTLKAHNDIAIDAALGMNNQLVLTADQDLSGAGNVIINKDVLASNITASGRDIIFASLDGGSTYGKFNGTAVTLAAANVITANVYGFASEVAASSLTMTAVNGIGSGGKVFVGDVANQISFANTTGSVNIYNTSASSTRSYTGTNTSGPIRLESNDAAFPTTIGTLASGGDMVLRMNNLTTAGGATINAGTNTVYLSAYSNSPVPSLSINGAQTFNLTGADINKISSGKVIIGNDSFGNITPSLSIAASAALSLSVTQPVELYGQSISTGANAISLAGGPLSLIADAMSLNGAINSGSNAISLTTLTPSQPITLGAGAGGLGLTAAELKTINGSGQLTIGSATHTGTISTDGPLDLTGGTYAGFWTRLDTSGGAISLNHDVTVPYYLGLITTNGGSTTAAVTGTGMLTTGGVGAMVVDSGSGINLSNAGNQASDLVMINRGTGNIVFNNNRNLILNSTNVAAGGSTTVTNATGTLITNSSGVTGSGAISLQTAGTLTVNNGNPVAASGAGAVSLTSTGGDIVLNGNVSSGSGTITLAAGGTITETGSGAISGSALSTSSVGGTTLGNANTVTSYSAANSGSGNLTLNNTATTLTLNGLNINNTATGGHITIGNTGAINTVGWLQTAGNGNIALTATGGTATIGNSLIAGDGAGTGGVSVTATGASSDILLNIINVYSGATGGGSGAINLSAGRNIGINAAVDTTGNVAVTAGGSITETPGSARIKGALLNTASVGGTSLPNVNMVSSFNAVNTGSGDVLFYNTAVPLTITGISQSGGGGVNVFNNGSIFTSGAMTLSGGMGLFTADGATSDITVNGAITKTSGTDSALTLLAQRSIVVNQAVASTSGKMDVNLVSHYLNDAAPGSVSIQNSISTNGGNLVVGGGTNPALIPAIGYDAATVGADKQYGVNLNMTAGGPALINTGGGNVSIRGQGVDGSSYDSLGIYLGNAQIHAGGGNILLDGKSGIDPVSVDNAGVYVTDVIDTTGTGTITIQGSGGANTSATTRNRGIFVTTAAAAIRTANGALSLTGSGGINTTNPSNPNNQGVLVNAGIVQSTGASVAINGTAGDAGSAAITNNKTIDGYAGVAINAGSGMFSQTVSTAQTTTTGLSSVIDITADSLTLGNPTSINAGGTGTVIIEPATPGRPIQVDATRTVGTLGLLSSDFGQITANTIQLGSAASGNIVLNSPVSASVNLDIVSGGSVSGTSNVVAQNFSAATAGGFTLTGTNQTTTASLVNTGSGAVSFMNNAGGNTLTVSGSNSAPSESFAVTESATGNLTVGPAGILTLDGPVTLQDQKTGGLLTVTGPVNTMSFGGTAGAAVNYIAHGMSLSGTTTGSVISLKPYLNFDNVELGGVGDANTLGVISLSSLTAPLITLGSISGNVAVSSAVTTPHVLSITAGGSVSQTAGATIQSTALQASGASVNLPEANPVGVIAGLATSGDFIYKSANGIAVMMVDGVAGITAAGAVSLDAASQLAIGDAGITAGNGIVATAAANGKLTLTGPVSSSAGNIEFGAASGGIEINNMIAAPGAGGSITLHTSGAFTNSYGTGVFAPGTGGNWWVWSADPTLDMRGGLVYDFKQYNALHGTSTVLGSGNGFLYSVAPVVSALLTGSVIKIYDATLAASLAGGNYSVAGVIDGDTVILNNPASGTFDSKDSGSGKTISVGGITMTSASNGAATVYGYDVAGTASGAIGVIDKAALTVSATGANKVYDGTTVATVTLSDNRISGDVLTVGGSAAFADKNAGSGKPVTVSTISISGTDAANYTVNSSAATTADIGTASLTVSATGINKVYDGTTAATVALADNRISGDVLTVGGSAAFVDKNAGSGKPVTVSAISISGVDASNYTVNNSAATTADIGKAALTVSASGINKVYDGTSAATVTLSDNRISSDVLTVGGSAAFADKNAGSGKPVTVSAINISGADAGNYIVNSSTTTSADIGKAPLTVTASGINKVYDGTTAATVTFADNRISGDILTLGGSAAFVDKNAGSGKPVTVSAISISGADAGNYTVNGSAATNADISKAPLTITAMPYSKTYDGGLGAGAVPAVTGLQSGDSTTGLLETYADKNAGTGKILNVSAYTINDGAGGANYIVSTVSDTSGTIVKAPLTVTASGINKVYDGTTAATVTLADNRINGDVLTLGGSAAFADKNAGSGKPVTVSAISISGTDAGNYTVNSSTATTADIAKAPLTVTATGVNKMYDGTTAATVTFADNRISGDILTLGGSAAFVDKNAGSGKPVTVSAISISGADAGNYAVNSSTATTADISKAPLIISASGINKIYDGTTAATITFADNRISGDILTVGGSAAFADKNAGSGKPVTVSAINISGTDAGNYTVNSSAATTADIDRASLTVTASASNKVYDGTTAAAVTLADNRISGDILTVGGSAVFADKNAGSGKPVTVSAISISGTDASNYTVNSNAATSADISAAPLTISANNASKTYGQTLVFTGSEYSSNGLQNNETIGSVSLSSTGAAATATAAESPYAIIASNAAGGSFDAGNYNINYINGELTVKNELVAADLQIVKEIALVETSPVAPAGLMPVSLPKTSDEPPPPAPPYTESVPEQPGSASATGSKGQNSAASQDGGEKDKGSDKDTDKKEKDKDKDKESAAQQPSGDKKDVKPKKNYCN